MLLAVCCTESTNSRTTRVADHLYYITNCCIKLFSVKCISLPRFIDVMPQSIICQMQSLEFSVSSLHMPQNAKITQKIPCSANDTTSKKEMFLIIVRLSHKTNTIVFTILSSLESQTCSPSMWTLILIFRMWKLACQTLIFGLDLGRCEIKRTECQNREVQ